MNRIWDGGDSDQFKGEVVRISEFKRRLIESRSPLDSDSIGSQPFLPVRQDLQWNRKRNGTYHAGTLNTGRCTFPGEKGYDGSWRSSPVTVVEMVGVRVVKIYGLFNKP